MKHLFIRSILVICFGFFAVDAEAKKPAKTSPFDLVKAHKKLQKRQTDFVVAQKSLTSADIVALEARLIDSYGPPKDTRSDLKVWEIENTKRGQGQPDKITVMCGFDEQGTPVFVIDGRGASAGDNPRLRQSANGDTSRRRTNALRERAALTKSAQPARIVSDLE